MDTHCLKCGMQVPSLGRFCPFCGTVVAHESLATAHEYHRAPGAFGGFFYGLIAAPILIIPGVLLCLLGWGLILGLPMILLGIMLPIAGPLFGMGEHKGKCPSCGTRIISVEDGKKHACPVCNARFAMEDQHTVGLDEHREGELQAK
jgi:DNA-directed RNA polymerase subunit RPC12/RpoP